MGKKGKKTRWRRLPIGGTDEESGPSLESAPPTTDPHRVTFNEDEYTKITTPRQDVLFKKGYFGRKRTTNPSPSDTQEVHSGDSVESESYTGEEPQYAYPTGYIDPNGVYYVNGNTFETYDPYTGTVTVVVGPPPQYPGGPPVLAALPCQPVPLQPVEWFNPSTPWCYSYNRRKRYSTDSQNCSAQSSESTGPPGSPQEPVDEGACAMYSPQYIYPGYMFGPPIYSMNGVTVQGVIPQPVPVPSDLSTSKRRKKRRRKRRGGVTDDGSESSCCEEPLTCDIAGCQSEISSDAVCQSGASSDAGAGPGSISSKANSDSGINTDLTPNSGSNSPPLHLQFDPTLAQVIESVNSAQFQCYQQQEENNLTSNQYHDKEQSAVVSHEFDVLAMCSNNESVNECKFNNKDKIQEEVTTLEEILDELSTNEDDVTPNLFAAAPEFSSQESTLSCVSTPSVTRELLLNENEFSLIDISQDEVFESCQSVSEADIAVSLHPEHLSEVIENNDSNSLKSVSPDNANNGDLKTLFKEDNESIKSLHEDVKEELLDDFIKEIPSNPNNLVPEIQTKVDESQSFQSDEMSQPTLSLDDEIETITIEEDLCNSNVESECSASTNKNLEPNMRYVFYHSNQEVSACKGTITPVPPPRRKRSMSRAADKLATRIVEEAIRKGIEEAICLRLRNPLSITEAVTRWLNSQGSSPLTCPISDSESDDEEIEIGEEMTDQKNVQGNPFLVLSRSGTGQRVAKDCESKDSSIDEWDTWDHSHTKDICDPARSVDKYYRLGADDGVGDKVPPSVYKTAMHIRHTGPFPCGVCCIIQ